MWSHEVEAPTLLAAFALIFSSLFSGASVPQDSVRVLQEVEVNLRSAPLGAVTDSLGHLSISGTALRRGLHVLGEADAVRALTALPGYENTSDYGSGIVVGGADYTVTSYSVDGAQVFYPFHFAGIFSTFNPNYFASVRVSPAAASLSAPFMLGADIEARTSQSVPSQLTGSASVGMLASGASLSLPLACRKMTVRGAVRAAYVPSGSYDDAYLDYDFIDANFSARYDFSPRSSLVFSSFLNSDKLAFSAVDNVVDSRLRWENIVNALAFTGSGSGISYSVNADFSHYDSSLNSCLAPVSLMLDSDISKAGLYGQVSFLPNAWELGFRMEHSALQPMRPSISGMATAGAVVPAMSDVLLGLGAARSWRLGGAVLRVAARGACYTSGDSRFGAFDPQLSFSFPGWGQWRVCVGHYSQFQHLVGLSDFGFASNFWLPSGMGLKPQRQWGVDVSYDSFVTGAVSLSVKGFAKRVTGSAQYLGTILDVIDIGYDPFLSTASTSGFNVGGDVLVAFHCGSFSGFGGYSLAVCRRRDPYCGRWTSSATEPLHTAKASLTWCPMPRLNLSAFFTLSSGRPYTPIDAIYIIAGNIVTHYGVINSARLPLYHRLDLSATYTFGDIRIGRSRIRNFVNLSIINFLRHRNVEMQFLRYQESNEYVSMKQVASLFRFLPSLSYTIEF